MADYLFFDSIFDVLIADNRVKTTRMLRDKTKSIRVGLLVPVKRKKEYDNANPPIPSEKRFDLFIDSLTVHPNFLRINMYNPDERNMEMVHVANTYKASAMLTNRVNCIINILPLYQILSLHLDESI